MTDRRLMAAVTILATGISAVATSFAIYATSARFVVSSFNHLLLEYLPGWFISAIIQRFGDVALELSLLFSGVVLSVVVGTIAFGGYRVGSRVETPAAPLVGFLVSSGSIAVATAVIVGELVPAVLPALVGGVIVTWFSDAVPAPSDVDAERRAVVTSLSAVAAFNIVAHALGLVRRDQTRRSEQELQEQASRAEVDHLLSTSEDAELDADGVQPLVSEVGDFFTVDINPSPPTVDTASWSLSITGDVEDELELGYDDVQTYTTRHEYKAIRCLSDGIESDQLDAAVWTGCRLGDLLAEAEPNGEYAMVTGADDYYYSIPLEQLEESMLAYGMNGLELPEAHGYPVRILVPDRWGKLQVKWLTEIEIIDDEAGGYWEERGWHGMGPVNAVTKIDRINRPDGRIQLVGHAYAGDRGIETVELSIDGGETWSDATLSDPLPDADTIRQWRFEIDPADTAQDQLEVYARNIDGDGTTQPEERTDPFPDGATGWVHRSIDIS
ncbi:nitrate reductase [Salinadaptatus halalkaliphilus]|uniref:Nitrate reductase n=1 Tax=Salinadaptatus halalkaliphilus TaxID=2419781 RepID=A0A4S3TQA9_9EURY|nr:molybdopterin-dependent oxidoreductase [Salinadaptatus halalkaliphilus]THE64748.1 nitrate reductase [Salinadaptatus halalkaliphilus]